jgi:peptidoglycan/xylan/chitin deacetylase (PgdA/CDA1 family)
MPKRTPEQPGQQQLRNQQPDITDQQPNRTITGSRLSRRDFLKIAGGMVAGVTAGAVLGLPDWVTNAQGPEKPRKPITLREADGFNWPPDLQGNELLLGRDIITTIDDCYDHNILRRMYELLAEHNATAAFFPNTVYQPLMNQEVRDIWRAIYAAGNDIGYHTTDHNFGTNLGERGNWSVERLERDFGEFTNHMRQILDDPSFTPRFARPPYGSWYGSWMPFIYKMGLTNVRWNYVPQGDFDIQYFRAVTRHPKGGRIILLHTRKWDDFWLQQNLGTLKKFAQSEDGRVITLRGDTTS